MTRLKLFLSRLTPPVVVSIASAVLVALAAFGVSLSVSQQAAVVVFAGAGALVLLKLPTAESIIGLVTAAIPVGVVFGLPVTSAQRESILILTGTIVSIVFGKGAVAALRARRAAAKPSAVQAAGTTTFDVVVSGEREHVYGWRRSLPGLAYPPANTAGLAIVTEVDPRPKMPPVFNQKRLGSCTANATAAAFQFDAILDGKDCGELSRLWIYYFERQIEGTLGQGDVGAMGHDAFTVAKNGIPDEKLWPYIESKFQVKPPASEPRAYTLTKQVRTVAQTEKAIKQVLSNGQTIAFGFTVYESFESEEVAGTGVVPMPKKGEKVLGGHEVLAVGFLKSHPGYILCRNSWDVTWGLGGYFLMPVAYLTSKSLSGDLRTIVRPLAA